MVQLYLQKDTLLIVALSEREGSLEEIVWQLRRESLPTRGAFWCEECQNLCMFPRLKLYFAFSRKARSFTNGPLFCAPGDGGNQLGMGCPPSIRLVCSCSSGISLFFSCLRDGLKEVQR